MLTFTISAVQMGGFLIATILPLLVGLVTTKITSGGVKAVLLAFLTLASSMLTEAVEAWQTGATYDLGQGLIVWLPVFIISVSTHFGLWKPTGVSGIMQDVGFGGVSKPSGTENNDL